MSEEFTIDLQNSYLTKFDIAQFVEDVDGFGERDVFTSRLLNVIYKLPKAGERTVKLDEGKRLDLISYRLYNTTSLWWILAEYNRISDFRDVEAGQVMLLPDISSLEDEVAKLQG